MVTFWTSLKDFLAKVNLSAWFLIKTLEQSNNLLLKTFKLTYEIKIKFVIKSSEFRDSSWHEVLHKFSSFKVFFEKGALNTHRWGEFMRIPSTHPSPNKHMQPTIPMPRYAIDLLNLYEKLLTYLKMLENLWQVLM